jgi:hypothetical protein
MRRQSVGGDAQLLRDIARGQTPRPMPNEKTEDAKPALMAKRSERVRCCAYFHIS